MSIKKLSDYTVSMISAGEVVESPASIIKELMENSIDAGAFNITVNIKDGGKSKIEVIDDGIGMSMRDLNICLENHTTSKLDDENLFNIKNHGFRGEALYSIRQCSDISILSKHKDSDIGYIITYDHLTNATELKPSACNIGTHIIVKNLFSRIPARANFLKSNSMETNKIKNIFKEISLAYPKINFKLYSNNKMLLNFSKNNDKNNLLNRYNQFFNKNINEHDILSINVNNNELGIKIHGFIGLPSLSHSSKNMIKYLVNNRVVTNKVTEDAIKHAYKGIIETSIYPITMLFINIEPNNIDVNIHPSKKEIKYRFEKDVYNFIKTELNKVLVKNNIRTSSKITENVISSYKKSRYETEINNPENLPLGKAIGQAHNLFVFTETKDGVIIIDQHAAHERIVHERLKESFLNKNVSVRNIEPYLVPISEPELFEDKIDELEKFGLKLQVLSDNTIAVHSLPSLIGNCDINKLIYDLEKSLFENPYANILEEDLEYICGEIACHNSIRAGEKLSNDDINLLLREMENTPNASHCNHGRPTLVKLTFDDMKKIFHR